MNKLILLLVTSLLSAQAYASSTVLAKVTDVSFTLIPASESIFCTTVDTDKDGIGDISRVSVLLSKNLGDGGPGFLQNNYISNEFSDPQGELCKKVDKIIEISPINFTATFGKYSSLLLMVPNELIENLTITIGTKGEVHGPHGLEVVDTEITLTETVTREITL